MALESLASAIASCVGNLAAEYASRCLRYFFRFGKIVQEFKNKRNELKSKRDEVKDDVDEALRQTEVIKKGVEEWLTKAEKELGEAQSLEEEIERNKCFNWCPSCGWRYCLSIKVAKKTLYISQLLAEACNFQRVGRRPPLQGIEFLLPKDFMASESSNSAFNGIMKALNCDGVNMIGLYGMPGVGKTTLAEVVGKQAKEQKLFDKAVSVAVYDIPNFNGIRERIAESLGLKFEASTEKGKAEELWRRLKGEKRILIILDDVWKELELQTIGIPFGGEHEGCKILLTTRLQQVCIQMNCQEKFELKILSEDEAWALFKDKADVEDDSLTLNVAKEVARECNGLPLAIVTVAKALKGRSLNGWIVANQRLRDSRPLDNQDVCGGIYSRLELSYNHLEDDNVKSCFLSCSLLPEDFEIPIEILVMCGIGQGLYHSINSVEALRWEICKALTILQQSGLLLEANDKEHIKMHDVARDFAHWITSRQENIFMVKDGLMTWPMSESFGCCTAISLWNIEINHFPNKVEFSKLKTLFLKGKNSLRVPCTFFEKMTTLQVLLLRDVVLTLEALQFLTNLRTLCLINCELQNISSLRNVENLEVFALLQTNIHELPKELVELHRLKSLYFSYSGDQDSNFPPNLLSRLTSLQELHVTSDNNANLLELNSLSGLTQLTLTVSTDQCSQENFVFPKLQSYNIAVNIENMKGLTSETLRIRDFSSSLYAFMELCNVKNITFTDINMKHENIFSPCLVQSVLHLEQLKIFTYRKLEQVFAFAQKMTPEQESLLPALERMLKEPTHHASLQSLKDVTFRKCDGVKSIFSSCLAQRLLHLEQLDISQCNELEQIITFAQEMAEQEAALLPNLTCLKLSSLPALESLWKEPTHHVSLQSLKEVIIHGCDKLKSIFSPYLAQSLLHLEKLQISDCEKLEQVFAFDKEMVELEKNQVPPLSNLIYLELKSLPELSCIWRRSSHFVSLPSLKTMRIQWCIKLVYLFSPILAQTLKHLEELNMQDCNSLKHLIKEAKNSDEVGSDKDRNLLWPNLKGLEIARCQSLTCVFPITLANGLPKLESLGIIDCPQLMHVFGMAKKMDRHEAKEMDRHKIELPQLKDLRLDNLGKLRSFCPKNYFVKFSSLKDRLQYWNQ